MRRSFTLQFWIKTLSVIVLLITTCANINAQVSGKVFKDFNANGTYDTGGSYNEIGQSGVVVNAYSTSGTLTVTYTGGGSSTNSTGEYTVTGGTLGQIRLEFTMPNNTFASNGSNGGTSVMFPTGATQDLAVNFPGEYCQSNPSIVLPCYESGNAFYPSSGSGNSNKGVVSMPYNSTGSTPTNISEVAKIYEIGTVWGMGFHPNTKRAFASSVLRRHSGLGPQGLGGIYVLDFNSGNGSITNSFSLEGVIPANGGSAISLGSVTRTGGSDYELPNSNTTDNIDLDAFDKVGKVGYGDLDYEYGANRIWVVNLFQKALISIDISSTTSYPGNVNQYLLSDMVGFPTCSNGEIRPWGLGFRNGKGYIGLVCTQENAGIASGLRAYVYSFNPNNPTTLTLEIDFPLDFARESAAYGSTAPANWNPWVETWAETGFSTSHQGEKAYPQPIVSDIEFADNGDMIIGFADRWGFQIGFQTFIPVSGTISSITANAAGDAIKVCNINGTWVLEGANGCAENDNSSAESVSQTDGPSGTGEFFYSDSYSDGFSGHNEIILGGLSILPGTNELLTAVYDPFNGNFAYDLGLLWHNISTGERLDAFMIVDSGAASSKGNDLGDVIAICNPAPLEIGNRVFMDTDNDGEQDADEMGLDGIKVELWKSGTKVTETTTANGGQWYFTNVDVNTDYEIKILAVDIPSGKQLTTTNIAANGKDLIDNDASLVGTDAVIAYKTGAAGENNHSLDFGFKVACTQPSAITVTQTAPTCTGTTANNDGKITFTSVTNADKYFINSGSTSTGTYATATAIPAAGTDIQTNIPNTGGTYTIRFYNGSESCYKDTTVTVTPFDCLICPNPHILVSEYGLSNPADDAILEFPLTATVSPTICGTKSGIGGEGIAIDDVNGYAYFTTRTSIIKYNRATGTSTTLFNTLGGHPFDIVLSSDKNSIYMTKREDGTPSGVLTKINATTGVVEATVPLSSFSPTGQGMLWGLAVHPTTQEVYVSLGYHWSSADIGKIYKLPANLSGTPTLVVTAPTIGHYMGLDFASNGSFWTILSITAHTPNGIEDKLYHYTSTGIELISKGLTPLTTTNHPFDLAIGPDNNIYVSAFNNFCVARYNPFSDTWVEYLDAVPGLGGKGLDFYCGEFICTPTCTQTSAITYTQTAPTCTGATANNNGKITFTGATNADKYFINSGSTSTGTYATATAIPVAGTDIQTNIPNTGGTYTIRFFNGSDNCFKDTTVTFNSVVCCNISATASGTNVSCNGGNNGTATVTPSGNLNPVTYLWSNGATTQNISSLSAGTYNVTVTESGTCTTSATYTVTEPSAITVTCTKTDVTTNGGSNGTASVVASGGTSPYTYLWSNGATTSSISGLSAGTYSVTVIDANNCSASCSSTVNEPGCNLSATASGTNVSCNGGNNGTATVTLSGNIGAVIYLWSNGATTQSLSNLTAGTYNVTVTESVNCIATSSYIVTQPNKIDAGQDQNLVCNGSNAPTTANLGAAPSGQTWYVLSQPSNANATIDNSGSASNLTKSGDYIFELRSDIDSNCKDSVKITVPNCIIPCPNPNCGTFSVRKL